jgi:hypothetical protein
MLKLKKVYLQDDDESEVLVDPILKPIKLFAKRKKKFIRKVMQRTTIFIE